MSVNCVAFLSKGELWFLVKVWLKDKFTEVGLPTSTC